MNKLQVRITGGREAILGQLIEVETEEIRFEVASRHLAEAIEQYYSDREVLRFRILELLPDGDVFSTSKWAELEDLETSDRFIIGTLYLTTVFVPAEARASSRPPKVLKDLIFDECTDEQVKISFQESGKYIRNPEEMPYYVSFDTEFDLGDCWRIYRNGGWNEYSEKLRKYGFINM